LLFVVDFVVCCLFVCDLGAPGGPYGGGAGGQPGQPGYGGNTLFAVLNVVFAFFITSM
jgi:hypothetical protein